MSQQNFAVYTEARASHRWSVGRCGHTAALQSCQNADDCPLHAHGNVPKLDKCEQMQYTCYDRSSFPVFVAY